MLMNNMNFNEFYKMIGLQIEQLPSSYNPEEYGRKLMSSFQQRSEVVYTSSTKVVTEKSISGACTICS